ncbi:MAG: peptidoglycan editing factor PgeF [Proteobacteria bacterium]|nr:peptidoglycan editing factor PgeF [Pseudomonadota bacterium]MBS0462546.1 peptidoglycan editing factor PgeF [Pseudomonadota bacterium]
MHGTRVATFGTSGNDPDTPHPNPPPQAGEGDATKVRHASTSERCNANHRSQAGQVDALDRTARGQRIAHHFPPPQAGEGWGGGNRLLRGGDWPPRDEPEADAAITRDAGVVLAILTADCLPVLLCSDDGAVVGAAHAGWRGLVGGVLERSVAAMGVDPARILAWLGPAAGPQAYEVGVEVRSAFVKPDAQAAIAFVATRPGHWLCDLYALARRRLMLAGVQRVYGGGLCTITDARRFYSFRRDGARSGRMASLICINEPVGGG